MENAGTASICVACPMCGALDFKLLYPASRGMLETISAEHFRCTSPYLSRHGDIVRCNRCHLLYSNPQFDPAQVLKIYRAVEDPIYLEEKVARERTFARSLLKMQRQAAPPGKLLDVGCYTGVFMKLAAKEGWTVTGVELSTWAANIARKNGYGQVHSLALEEADLELMSFDVVTLWDVIEHLSHPTAMLKNVHRLLKPGGIIAISTHLVDSFAARLLGSRYPFFMDMHLVHFSKLTLSRMLSECGFEVLACQRHIRILRLSYFFDKLDKRTQSLVLQKTFRWLSHRKFLGKCFIGIGFLGLVNVFAKKV